MTVVDHPTLRDGSNELGDVIAGELVLSDVEGSCTELSGVVLSVRVSLIQLDCDEIECVGQHAAAAIWGAAAVTVGSVPIDEVSVGVHAVVVEPRHGRYPLFVLMQQRPVVVGPGGVKIGF